MRSFREATRVFWTGWAEVPAYLHAVKEHAWEVLWGAGMIGIPFGIVTLYWSPAWQALGYVLAVLFFVGGYQLWRDYHLRLQPQLRVTKINAQKWRTATGILYDNSPMPPNKKNGDAIAYYFEISGVSEASTIRDVRVQLAEINPPVQHLNWLPILLFHKHDHPPHAEKFDLHPGDVKHIDLISGYRGDDHFEIRHIVDGANRNIPAGSYRLSVTITATDTPKISVYFAVCVDSEGLLQCKME
ncbi:MAG TPA: hypothetical protein VK578_21850 [Edaphobacter sp.]|nr:hypothetical protein [Edaphobacter sp.]